MVLIILILSLVSKHNINVLNNNINKNNLIINYLKNNLYNLNYLNIKSIPKIYKVKIEN
jgi:hypothetical protein